MQEKKDKSSVKKPIYKKWWFWVIIVVVLSAIFGNMGSNDENKPEQVNSEEDFSQDLNDLENDLLLTNFTPADKGDYQQSANDGFTECEVIEDEHSNDEDEHSKVN